MKKNSVRLESSAPAKVNLYLKLVGKREDGYHLLDSIFVPAEFLYDEIVITLSDDEKASVEMTSNLPEMADAENNLCAKAARLYLQKADINTKCHIHLEKNIPVGAGLGGGSSDCAAVLKLLNFHYRKFSAQELHELALSLGADVPFFLVNSISHVTGIGENIEPLGNIFNGHLLILSPSFSISTPWAFKHLNPSIIGRDPSNFEVKLIDALRNDDILTASEYLQNDFESLLFEKFPAYLIWKKFLIECGALHVGVSGSGSAFFALFDSDEKAENAKAKFSDSYSGFENRIWKRNKL